MMCLIVLAFGTAKADTAYWTLTFPADTQEGVSAYYKTWTASMDDGGAWSIYGFNNNNNSTRWTYIRAGWYNSAQIATISTTVSCDASISEVVLTVDKVTASDFNSPAYLQVATDASFSNITETVSLGTSDLVAGDWTFTITNPTSGAYYKLAFDMAKTDENGTLQVSKIVYNTSEKSNTDEDSTETDDDSEDTDDDDSDDSDDSSDTDDSGDTEDTDDDDVTVETTGSGTYADPYTASDATALCEASAYGSESVYVKGIISSISEVSTSYGNATYFISDDGTTTDEFEIYRGYGLDGEKFTSEDDIQVGDTVIVYGVLTLYYSTAEMTTGSSIVYLGRPESSDDDSEDTDDTDDEDVTVETTGSGTYADPYTASDATALCEASAYGSESVYVKGIISSISEVSTSYGNATYFISDDGTTTDEFEIYRGYGLDGEKFTSEDDIQVGDTVIVYGVLTLYYSTAEMTTGSSIVYLGRPESSDDDGDDTDDTDDETTYAVYAKASTVTSGQSYLLVVQDDENTMYATNHSASYTYGYLYVETVSGLVDTLTVDASGYNAFVLTASETTDGAYTLQDSYGRYLYQSGTYKSFNLSSTNDSYDWTLTQGDDGTWTIAYAASGYWIQYSTGYSSFGVYSSEQSNALLPYLYELVDSTTDTDDESDTDTDTDTDTDGDTDDDTDDDTTTTGDTYELVTDASSLAAGDVITFANADAQTGIGEQNENNRNFLTVAVTISDGILTAAETSATFTLSTADDGNWLIQYDLTGYYLTSNTASSNYLSTEESPDGLYSEVTIDIDSDGTATVVFQGDNERRWLRYNANGYFSVYAEGSQQDLQIYRKTASEDDSETAISSVSNTDTAAPQGVYTLSGVRLTGTDNLPAGLYVIDGKKVLVR